MRKNQFDFIAPVYYTLTRLVFGKKLLKIQQTFLDQIKDGSRILVVGGGNGEILSHPAFKRSARIDFLELSSKMIALARRNGNHLDQVDFINNDFFAHKGNYDLIICNFFLDCFDERGLQSAVVKLDSMMDSDPQLIVTDFRPTQKSRHKWLLQMMIKFFRLTANLEAHELLNIETALGARFDLKQREEACNGLLFSSVFEVTGQ